MLVFALWRNSSVAPVRPRSTYYRLEAGVVRWKGMFDAAQRHKTSLVAMGADWKLVPGRLTMSPHPYNARSSISENQGMGRVRKIAVINTGGSADYQHGEVRIYLDYLVDVTNHDMLNFLPLADDLSNAYTP